MTVAVFITILLMVFIINAINLIDGIDGLASGLSAIACAFYAYLFFDILSFCRGHTRCFGAVFRVQRVRQSGETQKNLHG